MGTHGGQQSLPPGLSALVLQLRPDEVDVYFDARTNLCILITIKTSELMLEKFSHCFPEDGNSPAVE